MRVNRLEHEMCAAGNVGDTRANADRFRLCQGRANQDQWMRADTYRDTERLKDTHNCVPFCEFCPDSVREIFSGRATLLVWRAGERLRHAARVMARWRV